LQGASRSNGLFRKALVCFPSDTQTRWLSGARCSRKENNPVDGDEYLLRLFLDRRMKQPVRCFLENSQTSGFEASMDS
jgi:hypothetical protein